jgi:hypothetical protein
MTRQPGPPGESDKRYFLMLRRFSLRNLPVSPPVGMLFADSEKIQGVNASRFCKESFTPMMIGMNVAAYQTPTPTPTRGP